MKVHARRLIPLLVALGIALCPVPEGLASYSWYFFAIFTGCITMLITDAFPGAVSGLICVSLAAVLAPWALFSPEQMAAPGFKVHQQAFQWAVSGFSNSVVWMILGAFILARGYAVTGLGRRIALWLVKTMGHHSLSLGYAVMLADLVLAPATPSNTARSGGILFPIIDNLPPLFDSYPNSPSRRRIGTYLMWTSLASCCVSCTLFMTAISSNLLAVERVTHITGITIGWSEWFIAAAPAGIIMALLTPLMGYVFCRPEVTAGHEVAEWAREELGRMGRIRREEIVLTVLIVGALLLWIFGGRYIEPAMVGLVVGAIMLMTGIISWNDVLEYKAAWSTFFWFAMLIALASGLDQVGFISWFGERFGHCIQSWSPLQAVLLITIVFFVLHYFFAGATTQVIALLPAFLAAAHYIPGIDMHFLILMLVPTIGIMGILTPYGTGPSPVYFGSGYIPSGQGWRLGAIFGGIYLVLWLVIGMPWIGWLCGAL
ncbi:anion permease [Zymobacter palmae]|uniref:Di-and tricarboxylate transporters n=1 Tax=Zymobacter palmae TaxID=33074 RepID=A0A348HGI5_9GAMM|nr:anion permease [Zymobacter palmae]BBG30737.1 di- and tricarboxylate transporters [Zymobacter palmae]